MGIFSALAGHHTPNPPAKSTNTKAAARNARRGGSAIVATISKPRTGRVVRTRGGSKLG